MTDEEKDESVPPILIMYDNRSKALWGLQVESKAVTKEVVHYVTEKLEEAGYIGVRTTLNSDQGESMVALKKAVALRRKA